MKKNSNPHISVIMNCRNGERYLTQSIKSIINQTFKNWELIFFDNQSSDNSKKILKSFKDKRIKYLKSKKILNLYNARNQAINHAKGKYITFLDTDDLWTKDKLNKQFEFFKKNKNSYILYTNYFHYLQNKKKKKITFLKKLKSGFITKDLLRNYTIGIITAMLHKNVFKKIKFKNKFNIIGDFDFFIRSSKIFKISYMHKPLAVYRVHDLNFSKKNLKVYIKELSNWISENQNKFAENDLYQIKKNILKIKLKYYLRFLGV